MTEICNTNGLGFENKMVASELRGGSCGAAAAMEKKSALLDSLEERLQAICAVCPDFLVPTVLEGMLGELVIDTPIQQLQQAVRTLQVGRQGKHQGYLLGLEALCGCVQEGPSTFFARLHAMSVEQIKAFRQAACQ